jgi:7,8-dihydroneopterin aldolase/epimerase/oxygenase
MDDPHSVFGSLQQRAASSPSEVPADRISVRDYVRRAEIGAYLIERGVTQRLRFNVVLEVARDVGELEDDIDDVVSYDTITSAIDRLLAQDRLDLLETLAERIARACLEDARVLRAFVRVEKLDRIPGALGVEIVRGRIGPETPQLHPEAFKGDPHKRPVDVVFLGPEALVLDGGKRWLDAIAASERTSVVCIGPAAPVAANRSPNTRRIGYLAIEIAALHLADTNGRFRVVASRSELEWSLSCGLRPIWAPTRMADVARSPDVPDASKPQFLARWLSDELGGRLILVTREEAVPEGGIRLMPDRPDLFRTT